MMSPSIHPARPKAITVLSGLLVLGTACTGEDFAGSGTLELSLSGGQAMREGFPHVEPGIGDLQFVDGWTVRFDRFLVAMGSVSVRVALPDSDPSDGPLVAGWAGPSVVDIMRPATGVAFATIPDVPAERQDLGFEIVSAASGATNVSATAEDFQTMTENGWTVWFEGVANRPEATLTSTAVRFSVGVTMPTRFRRCVNGLDQTRGVAIPSEGTLGAFIYPHIVHVFWDRLAGGESRLRFDPWAAVAGSDDVVTMDELGTQDLTSPRYANGEEIIDPITNAPRPYDDGGLLPNDQLNLADYITYALREGFHFNGLGFCPWTPI